MSKIIGTLPYASSWQNQIDYNNTAVQSAVLANGTMAQIVFNSNGWSFAVSTDGGNTWTSSALTHGPQYTSIWPTADGLGFWCIMHGGSGGSATVAAGAQGTTYCSDYVYAMRWTTAGFSGITQIASATHSYTYTNNGTTSTTYNDSWSYGYAVMYGDTVYFLSSDTNGTFYSASQLSGGSTSGSAVGYAAVNTTFINSGAYTSPWLPMSATTGFANGAGSWWTTGTQNLTVYAFYGTGTSVSESISGVSVYYTYPQLVDDGNGNIYLMWFSASGTLTIYKRANAQITSTAQTWTLYKTITGLPAQTTNSSTANQRALSVPSTGKIYFLYQTAPGTTGYNSNGDIIAVDILAGTFKTAFSNTANQGSLYSLTTPIRPSTSYGYFNLEYESASNQSQYLVIELNVPPTAPTWSTQPPNNNAVGSTISLAWNSSTVGDSGDTLTYTLQQSISGGAWTNVATGLTGTSYTYTVPNNAGSNVKFQVIANESNGLTTTSAVSNTVNIVAVPSSPTAGTEPTVLKPSSANSLTWNSVSPQGGGDTITYTLQYKDVTANGSWTNIATGITGTSYSWTPSPALTAGHNYSVQVIAVENDGGQSTPTVIINNMPTFVPMSSLILPQPNNPSAKANIDYLRTQVNTFRSNNGRSSWNWTDPTIIAGVTPVKAVHMTEIQQAIDDVYSNLSVAYASSSTQIEVKQTVVSKDPINFPIREMSTRLQYILKALQNN